MSITQLYDDALTIVDALLLDEDDFHRASRLNTIMVELAVLKHATPEPIAHRRDWLASLDYWDKHSM